MFCPVCNADYRDGFTVCSDCGVALVSELPKIGFPGGYFLLWEGEDPVLHDTLTEELRQQRLHYVDTPLDAYRRGSADPLNLNLRPKFGFAVSVLESDREQAVPVLERLLEIEPAEVPVGSLLPAQQKQDYGTELGPREVLWDESTPVVELCTAERAEVLDFLQSALQGVGIPSRRAGSGASQEMLLVRAEDETAARQIERQISGNAVPATSAPEPTPSVWYDDPIESYALLWIVSIATVFLGMFLVGPAADKRSGLTGLVFLTGSIATLVSQLGALWMLYQAVRYEVRPFRFVILSFLPFAFLWYYTERYSKRRAASRVPFAIRVRMQRPAR